MKYNEIKMKWTNGGACPEGLTLTDICHIVKKDGKLFFTNGNLELPTDEIALQNLFTLTDNISWDKIDFTETLKKYIK